jgi:hypothetical protein
MSKNYALCLWKSNWKEFCIKAGKTLLSFFQQQYSKSFWPNCLRLSVSLSSKKNLLFLFVVGGSLMSLLDMGSLVILIWVWRNEDLKCPCAGRWVPPWCLCPAIWDQRHSVCVWRCQVSLPSYEITYISVQLWNPKVSPSSYMRSHVSVQVEGSCMTQFSVVGGSLYVSLL